MFWALISNWLVPAEAGMPETVLPQTSRKLVAAVVHPGTPVVGLRLELKLLGATTGLVTSNPPFNTRF